MINLSVVPLLKESPKFLHKTGNFRKLRESSLKIAVYNGIVEDSDEYKRVEDCLKDLSSSTTTINSTNTTREEGEDSVLNYMHILIPIYFSMYGSNVVYDASYNNLDSLGFKTVQASGILLSLIDHLTYRVYLTFLEKLDFKKVQKVVTWAMTIALVVSIFTVGRSNAIIFWTNQIITFGIVSPMNSILYLTSYKDIYSNLPVDLYGTTFSIKDFFTKIVGSSTPYFVRYCKENGLPILLLALPCFGFSGLSRFLLSKRDIKVVKGQLGDSKVKGE